MVFEFSVMKVGTVHFNVIFMYTNLASVSFGKCRTKLDTESASHQIFKTLVRALKYLN